MDFTDINARGAVLLGCGKMGSALLAGWLDRGLSPGAVTVLDPAPSDWLRGTGAALNADLPPAPALTLIAVKPQMMGDALPALRTLRDTLFVTVAAGTPIAAYEAALGDIRLVRAMPNTPAAIGRGITALIGNAAATAADLDMAEGFLAAVGEVVRLDHEDQMDAVTGLSGSGPAYVFHMIEAMKACRGSPGPRPRPRPPPRPRDRGRGRRAGHDRHRSGPTPDRRDQPERHDPGGAGRADARTPRPDAPHRGRRRRPLAGVARMTDPIDFDDFLKVDIRVGRILRAEPFPEARKPALKMWIDFGGEIGERKTSAQVTAHYTPETLVGRQVVAVVNFPPRQIGPFRSEVLVLGLPDADGEVVLLCPDQAVPDGGRMH